MAQKTVPTVVVCKADGSNKRRINQDQLDEYATRGYQPLNNEQKFEESKGELMGSIGNAENPEDALSDTPPNPEDTHPNGKDPIDPQMKIPSDPTAGPLTEPLDNGPSDDEPDDGAFTD